jgi:hypothetical protein
MERLRNKLTYANVISTLCLCLLVGGGTAFAATQLPKNSVGINLSSIGTVPTATSSTNAAHAGTADTATNATHAANADTVGGHAASSFAPSQAEPVRIVGAPGQVPFEAGWEVGGNEMVPGFWKDPFGTVHMQGQAGRSSGTDETIFTLPPGFRTTENEYFSVYPSGGLETTTVQVLPNGQVNLFSGDPGFVGLGNISFRAAGS